jgi:hypothetical protein
LGSGEHWGSMGGKSRGRVAQIVVCRKVGPGAPTVFRFSDKRVSIFLQEASRPQARDVFGLPYRRALCHTPPPIACRDVNPVCGFTSRDASSCNLREAVG